MVLFRVCLIVFSACLVSLTCGQSWVALRANQYEFSDKSVRLSAVIDRKGTVQATVANALPVRWAFVRTGQVQENRDSLADWTAANGQINVPVEGAGPVIVGIDFQPVIESVPLANFGRTNLIRVRHWRSALLVARHEVPGDVSAGSGVAVTELSLASSIQPLMDPTTLTGGDMAFEVRTSRGEIEEGEVTVKNLTTGKSQSIRFGEERGLCHFHPDPGCEYLLTCETLLGVQGDPDVDQELFSTALTFKVPSKSEDRQ